MIKKFRETDINNDGFINYQEFRTMVYSLLRNYTNEDEIHRLFRIIDKDGNGEITVEGIFIFSLIMIQFFAKNNRIKIRFLKIFYPFFWPIV